MEKANNSCWRLVGEMHDACNGRGQGGMTNPRCLGRDDASRVHAITLQNLHVGVVGDLIDPRVVVVQEALCGGGLQSCKIAGELIDAATEEKTRGQRTRDS